MTVEQKRASIVAHCASSYCNDCKLFDIYGGNGHCWLKATDEEIDKNFSYLFSNEGIKPDETASAIEHPSHYAGEKYECIEVMREVFGDEAVNSFCLCNAFKYLWRCNKKHDDATTDLKKARYYIDHLINHLGGA
jgi:hypothetical protein